MKLASLVTCACLWALVCSSALAGAAPAAERAVATPAQAAAEPAADAVQMLDKAIALVREHAYHVDRIDWSQTGPRLRAMVRGARRRPTLIRRSAH